MKKYIRIMLLVLLLMLAIPSGVEAANASIKASSTSVSVGDSVTITTTYTAAAWNLTVSGTGVSTTKYVDVTDDAENTTKTQSIKLNTSKEGTYTIKLTGDITDGTTGATTNVNTSVTVTVKAKPVETTTPSTNNNSNSNSGTTTNTTAQATKPSTSTTTTNNNKTETKKEEIKQEEVEEVKEEEKIVEEEILPFGISKLTLYGINDFEGREKLVLSPEFDINTFEYTCNVESNIKRIELEKNANNWDEYLQIDGLDQDLQDGENVITLHMQKDDKDITYKIIVNKEAVEEVIQNESISGETILIFSAILVIAMTLEAIIFIIIIKKKYIKREINRL